MATIKSIRWIAESLRPAFKHKITLGATLHGCSIGFKTGASACLALLSRECALLCDDMWTLKLGVFMRESMSARLMEEDASTDTRTINGHIAAVRHMQPGSDLIGLASRHRGIHA